MDHGKEPCLPQRTRLVVVPSGRRGRRVGECPGPYRHAHLHLHWGEGSTNGGRQAPQEEDEEEEVEDVGEGRWAKPRLEVAPAPPLGCRGTPKPGSSAGEEEAVFSHG